VPRESDLARGLVACQEAPAHEHDADAVYVDASSTIGVLSGGVDASPAPTIVAALAIACEPVHAADRFTWAPPRYGQRVPDILASTRLIV
jgi:hypothetical protein